MTTSVRAATEPWRRYLFDFVWAVAYRARVERWIGCLACLPLIGCALISPLPDRRTPADRARALEARCAGDSAQSRAQVLSAGVIDSVEPAYSHVQSGPGDREARLRGARIHVQPVAGFSRELLARTIECHQARVTLEGTPAAPDDPYTLPGAWLDIDVDSEGDGFVVVVSANDFADAKQVLDRARRFGAMKARE